MFLIIWTQTFKDFNSLLCRWFFHCHRLESSFQCCIFFDIFTVFLQSSRSDKLNLASGKRRFQDIGRIQCSLRSTCSDDGMDFINEQQNSLMFFYFLDHILNAFLKFTSVFASRNHAGKIQHNKTLILHCIRNHSHNDALCKSLYNGSLTYSGFPCQTRIILCTSAQDLDQSGNFFITPYHRIQFSLCSKLCQVTTVLIQCWGTSHFLVSRIPCVLKFLCDGIVVKSHSCQNSRKQLLDIYSHCKKQPSRYAVCLFQKRKQKMLCSAKTFHTLSIFLRLFNDSSCSWTVLGIFCFCCRSIALNRCNQAADKFPEFFFFYVKFLQHFSRSTFRFFQKTCKKMFCSDISMSTGFRSCLCQFEGILCLSGKLSLHVLSYLFSLYSSKISSIS